MNRIKELEGLILKARKDYYNDEAKVPDQLFDAWVDELKQLDPNNKAITNIGAPTPVSEWKKYNHSISMGSLDKVNTSKELTKWYDGKSILNVSEKLDGISINCEYENGKLVRALTRGNGIKGENILNNVIKMEGVKKYIPDFNGSLRGEIILRKSNYKKYFSDKANTRNAASGIAKRLDGAGSQHLTVIFYQVVGDSNFEYDKENKCIDWLSSNGMLVPGGICTSNIESVIELYKKYQNGYRESLDYDIDGLVVGYNDLKYKQSLGSIHNRPKGARAFKFENVFIETTLEKVIWQVGNSGRLTPLGFVDPVHILGSKVSKASIYNISYIKKVNLTIGAKVLITKANDIIPRIEQVVENTNELVEVPTNCPECNSLLKMKGENLTCVNSSSCPAQTTGKIKNWISGLGILEWGNKLVEKLVENELVKDPSDLYKLSLNDLSNLERMGEKSATNCLEQLHNNKEITLDMFLGSLSISMNGKSSIKMVMSGGFNTLESIRNATVQELENINGMGSIKSQLLYDGIINNKNIIDNLIKNGIIIKEPVVGKLKGSFCFSGSFSKKRDELEKIVIDNGGDVKKDVSKSLTYLVLQDPNSGSSKAKKAKKLGIIILSEDDFFKMLE